MVRRLDRGITALARRVRWERVSQSSQQAIMARLGAYLFVSGALILSLSLLLPSDHRNVDALIVVAFGAVFCAIIELALFERITAWGFNVMAALGTGLVTCVIFFGGSLGQNFRPLYLWVTLYAAYFFTRRQMAAQGILAIAGYTLATFAPNNDHAPWLGWLVTVSSFGICSILVALLRGRLEELLASEKRHVDELLSLDRMKSEVIAVVSHELRTPLSSVYGSAITLRERRDTSEEIRDRLVDIIVSESQRLERLADNVLWVSRIDANRVAVQTETVDLAETAREIAERAAANLPDGHTIDVNASDGPVLVEADRDKLAQVLRNLIENAVKYSPAGGLVSIKVGRDEASGNGRISVCDQGIGIAVSDQERIFEKFERVDPEMANGISGTGLGLFICRDLARKMGGDVSVDSEPGSGSTFHLDLPDAKAT